MDLDWDLDYVLRHEIGGLVSSIEIVYDLLTMANSKIKSKGARRKRLHVLLLIGLSLFAYDLNRLENTSGDTISNRYLPAAILKHHTITLNAFRAGLEGVRYLALQDNRTGDYLPRSHWGIAVVTVPFYAIVDLLDLGGSTWDDQRISRVSRWNAIFLAISTTLLIYLLLTRFLSLNAAFAASLVFAFGTWHWSLGAQGLSSQIISVFIVSGAMNLTWLATTSPARNRLQRLFPVLLALSHALMWSNRPQDIFLLLPMVLLLRNPKQVLAYALTFAALIYPLSLLYQQHYGGPLGWISALALPPNVPEVTYRAEFYLGFLGLLFSPNRGAITFFPLLLLVPLIWMRMMPEMGFSALARSVTRLRLPKLEASSVSGVPGPLAQAWGLGAILYLAHISFVDFWHSTWSYGARYLYDVLPLIWPAVGVAFGEVEKYLKGAKSKLRRWQVTIIIAASIQGFLIHWLGHRNFDIYVWNFPAQVDEARAWNLKDFMLIEVWKAGSNSQRHPDARRRLIDYGY